MILMGNQYEKDALLLREIHKILLKQWDPLKIKRLPSMRDEYEEYLPHLFKLLRNDAKEIAIFEYLWWVESILLEKPRDRKYAIKAAQALRDLKI